MLPSAGAEVLTGPEYPVINVTLVVTGESSEAGLAEAEWGVGIEHEEQTEGDEAAEGDAGTSAEGDED